MKIKETTQFLIIFISVVLISGCLQQTNEEINTSSETLALTGTEQGTVEEMESRTIVDMDGVEWTIPKEVKRVVANGAGNQIVFMVGGADKLVGTASTVQQNEMFVKIYPRITEVDTVFATGKDVNFEELVKLEPDVIIGNLDNAEEYGLVDLNIKNQNPEDIKKEVLLVGELFGEEEYRKAEEFCDYYDGNLNYVTERTKALTDEEKVKVFVAGADILSTEGIGSITSSWIENAGGINVAAEAGVKERGTMSLEDLITLNPDIIITRDRATSEELLKNEQYKDINAVKAGKIYVNPKGVYLWGVRSAETALQTLWAAKIIHPELFEDLDMNAETKEFYSTFYNYELSETELDEILNPQ
jgi:iron complex transport system substrate-binding protein